MTSCRHCSRKTGKLDLREEGGAIVRDNRYVLPKRFLPAIIEFLPPRPTLSFFLLGGFVGISSALKPPNDRRRCVSYRFEGKNIGVRLMEHNRSTNDESKHIDLKVLRVIKHKGYSPTSYNNDIALLRMDTEGVEFSPDTGIHPVCLPVEGMLTVYYSLLYYHGKLQGGGVLDNSVERTIDTESGAVG